MLYATLHVGCSVVTSSVSVLCLKGEGNVTIFIYLDFCRGERVCTVWLTVEALTYGEAAYM